MEKRGRNADAIAARWLGVLVVAVAVACLVAVGCARSRGTVSGKVTFDGRPLTTGVVQVEDSEGGVHAGPIQPDGTYAVTGVPTGPARLTVSALEGDEPPAPAEPDKAEANPDRDGVRARRVGKARDPVSLIPERYNDFGDSGLTVEVRKGITPFDIDLRK